MVQFYRGIIDFKNQVNKVVVAFALYYNMANLLIDNPIK